MTAKYSLYLGEAGQDAASSFFLARGWNVAIPRVDVGDDFFVVEDKEGAFLRIQVKTAQAIERKQGFSAYFKLPIKQLQKNYEPELYYMFMVYRENDWYNKLIIPREALFGYYLTQQKGSPADDNLVVYFSFKKSKVLWSKTDITEFFNNFDDFPIISH